MFRRVGTGKTGSTMHFTKLERTSQTHLMEPPIMKTFWKEFL